MNKSYVIAPAILIIAFIGYYMVFKKGFNERHELELRDRQRIEAEALENKKRQQALAAEENRKQAEVRAAEEQKKLDEKRRKQFEADEKIRRDTATAVAANRAASEKKGLLEAELAETRRAREKADREAFEAVKDLETLKIQRRNAELEIQRAAEFIANKVDATSLVEIPVFPDPKAKK